MAISNATIYRTDNDTKLDLGRFDSKAKMKQFRLIQANGEAVCNLFDDCGEFDFVWNKAAKTWEFFSEAGNLVGSMVIERDLTAEKAEKDRYYRESMNAYAAQQKLNSEAA